MREAERNTPCLNHKIKYLLAEIGATAWPDQTFFFQPNTADITLWCELNVACDKQNAGDIGAKEPSVPFEEVCDEPLSDESSPAALCIAAFAT